MKLSGLNTGYAPSDGSEQPLLYARSELADPPITIAEARAVDLGGDTTVCRWHKGELAQLNIEGRVYFCAVGRQYFRHSKQLSDFLRPLH
jgi:hypothetical protein